MEACKKKGAVIDMTEDSMFKVISKQAREVDFMTIHSGITLKSLEELKKGERLIDITSRGGSFLAAWMIKTGKENPLYKEFDYLLELVKDLNCVLSLGDALRPGSIIDSNDQIQLMELKTLGVLAKKCRTKNTPFIIEGPGHMPLNQIADHVRLEKKLIDAPYYVLGPLVIDNATGYDHIAAAIGGAIAAYNGADFLCYVTPSEHISLPTTKDVKDGVIAARIAARAADVARGRGLDVDRGLSTARANLDWSKQGQFLIDREQAEAFEDKKSGDVCTMCGEFCALRIVRDFLSD
jgi:phosphomethylpyrimidine synthase